MPPLFAGSGLLGRQLGNIGGLQPGDLDRLSIPTTSQSDFTDTGLASTMTPGVQEFGGLTKESWFGSGAGTGAGIKESGASLAPGFSSGGGTSLGGGGSVGQFGDAGLSTLNNYDNAFQQAGARNGIDPNWLKSIAAIEGHYDNSVDQYGAVGIMGIMPGGYPELEAAFPGWQTDPSQNIALGAAILAQKMRENGGTIEGGIQGYLGWGTDAYGTSNTDYLARAQQYYAQLQQGGGSFAGGGQQPINGLWGGNPVGNSFVQAAMQFVGVDYNWGAIPGANENPWQTGWDCSGFTYYMNQKYGDSSLPMGSHYQYQYAQQTGQLFTDLNQLQPGDLVFIDTGWQGGSGAELNRAGHVGIYIGNGQMIHAANESVGTIISPLSGYGGILGGMHQSGSSRGFSPAGVGAMTSGSGNPLGLLDRVRGWQG